MVQKIKDGLGKYIARTDSQLWMMNCSSGCIIFSIHKIYITGREYYAYN